MNATECIIVENKRKSYSKKISLYSPEAFQPEMLPPKLRQYVDFARYMLHCMHMARVFKRQNTDGSVNLKRDYLTQVIPKAIMTPLREGMVAQGLLCCDNQYLIGEKSYSYSIGPALAGSPIKRVDIEPRSTAGRKIKQLRTSENRKITDSDQIWLRQKQSDLKINMVEARNLAASDAQVTLADLIDSQQGNYTVCDYGRIHTPLTRLQVSMRKALSLKGQPVIFTDLVNSQPLFLGLLVLLNQAKGKHCIKIDLAKYCDLDEMIASIITPFPSPLPSIVQNPLSSSNGSLPETPSDPSNSSPLPISKKIQSISCSSLSITMPIRHENGTEEEDTKDFKTIKISRELMSQDQREYLELCEAGSFYESVMGKAGITDRDVAKEMMFSVLFSSNRTQSDLKNLFRELFPKVDEIARIYKKHDNSHLPKLLQRLESSFFIHRVCRRLRFEHPEMPIVTIHDSVGTTAEYIDIVETIILEEFGKLGLTPQLRRQNETTSQDKSQSQETLAPSRPGRGDSSESGSEGARGQYRLDRERLSGRPLDASLHSPGNTEGLRGSQTLQNAPRRFQEPLGDPFVALELEEPLTARMNRCRTTYSHNA
jgi:hypothetical protein